MESNIQKPSVSVPVIIWHLQEDSEQKLNCFTLGRDDYHVGPRSQIEGLCDIALGFKNYALDSVSELRKEGGWQPLPEGLELEENMKMVRNPLSAWTQPPGETHHLPDPFPFTKTVLQALKRETVLTWIFKMPQNSECYLI